MKNTAYLLFLFSLSGLFRPALAIDLQPGDIVAPPPQVTLVTISYVNSQNNDLFRNGVNTGADPKLESNTAFIRLTHSYSIGSLPAVTFVQTGAGALSTDGSLAAFPGSKGITDSSIVTAIWPYSNHATRTYLGLAAYLFLPTGGYSNTKAFNLGSNRYAQALQIGYQRPITKNMDAAVASIPPGLGLIAHALQHVYLIKICSLRKSPSIPSKLGRFTKSIKPIRSAQPMSMSPAVKPHGME